MADEAMLVIHRDVKGDHEESRDCWCRPVVLAPDEADQWLRNHPGDTPVGKDS
jgi:hypothetical protein